MNRSAQLDLGSAAVNEALTRNVCYRRNLESPYDLLHVNQAKAPSSRKIANARRRSISGRREHVREPQGGARQVFECQKHCPRTQVAAFGRIAQTGTRPAPPTDLPDPV